MSTITSPSEPVLSEFAYGSVWLVGAAGSSRNQISSLATYALKTADAVIHEPAIGQSILDLVELPRYREAADRARAIERSIKLAEDGWRVVLLVQGSAVECAAECGKHFVERHVPLRIVPAADDPSAGHAPLSMVFTRQLSAAGPGAAALIVVVADPPFEPVPSTRRRSAPVSFSMCGIAG